MIKPKIDVFVLFEVDVTLVDGCGIWKHWLKFREVKCLQGCSQTLWFSFLALVKESGDSLRFSLVVFWCKPGVLGGRGSPIFPCVTQVVQGFSSDLPQAISYWAESHLGNCQTYTMERPQHLDYFCKNGSTVAVWLNSKCVSDWRCCKCGV